MSQLDRALAAFAKHEGVRHVLLVGADGLLVRHVGVEGGPDRERLAAMAPGVASGCAAMARAAGSGAFSTAVIEMTDAVVVVASLSTELLLAVLLEPGVGFAGLLRDLRQERGHLASLL